MCTVPKKNEKKNLNIEVPVGYPLLKNQSLDPQGSAAAGEPDPWVTLPAGIPTGIPTGNPYGPAPMSSLN